MVFPVPIVLILYNRPELVGQVFRRILAVQPQRLFLVADGPSPGENPAGCDAARAVVEAVPPGTAVTLIYSAQNLGLRRRVQTGLDRVFSEVDRAIILEDDCLPHPSFFSFCAELLEAFQSHPQVGAISGNNFQDGIRRGRGSYTFRHLYNSGHGGVWDHLQVRIMNRWRRLRRAWVS